MDVCGPTATRNHVESPGLGWSYHRRYIGVLKRLTPKAILMPIDCVSAWGHVDVHGPCYHWRPFGSMWPVLSSEFMLMCMDGATARGHGDVSALCCRLSPCCCPWPMLTLRGVEVWWCPGLCCGRGPCLGSALPLETMLMPEAGCCHQKPHGSPWSVLTLTIKNKEAPFSVITPAVSSWNKTSQYNWPLVNLTHKHITSKPQPLHSYSSPRSK